MLFNDEGRMVRFCYIACVSQRHEPGLWMLFKGDGEEEEERKERLLFRYEGRTVGMLFKDEGRMEGRTPHLDSAASECMGQSSPYELLLACHQSPGAGP